VTEDDPPRGTLAAYFTWATEQLSRYPDTADAVPDGLSMPRWSWDGPQDSG
jgi:hemoglobin